METLGSEEMVGQQKQNGRRKPGSLGNCRVQGGGRNGAGRASSLWHTIRSRDPRTKARPHTDHPQPTDFMYTFKKIPITVAAAKKKGNIKGSVDGGDD